MKRAKRAVIYTQKQLNMFFLIMRKKIITFTVKPYKLGDFFLKKKII